MNTPLDDVCGCSLPREDLAALAGLRRLADVRVSRAGDRAWVRWPAGMEQVLRQVFPVPGAELYVRREGRWYRYGHRLPAFDLPLDGETQPLARALLPEVPPVEAAVRPNGLPVVLGLCQDDQPRQTTGMWCAPAALAAWAETATSAELSAIRAAWTGEAVMLLGKALPALADAERFWGERVLVPLGYRLEPALPEGAVRESLGVTDDEILVHRAAGAQVVPLGAFRPLTRAAVRLSLERRP
jgi:hypothetical protein